MRFVIFTMLAVMACFTTWAFSSEGVTKHTIANERNNPEVGCKSGIIRRNTYAGISVDALGDAQMARQQNASPWLFDLLKREQIARLAAKEGVCVLHSSGSITAVLNDQHRKLFVQTADISVER